jgi:hypothetical protein
VACCLDGGTCIDIRASACVGAGGAPGEVGSECGDVTCIEACCLPGDFCLNLEPNVCIGGTGQPQGAGSDCDDDPELCVGAGCVRNPAWQCDGDVDGDRQVNPVDSGLVQAAFGSSDEQDLCNYDMDCDGQINPVDSGIVQSLFGTCEPVREVCP